MMNDTATPIARNQIAFFLSDLPDLVTLCASIPDETEVRVLDASGNALAQRAEILSARTGLSAIHLFSDGTAGNLDLGSTTLNHANLAGHAPELATVRAALATDADFLIYGCNAAEGEAGQACIAALANTTGADVAASEDLTGAACACTSGSAPASAVSVLCRSRGASKSAG